MRVATMRQRCSPPVVTRRELMGAIVRCRGVYLCRPGFVSSVAAAVMRWPHGLMAGPGQSTNEGAGGRQESACQLAKS